MKHTSRQTEIRWSGWIESMQKDDECTFGILKQRFRILKTGIRLYGVDKVDTVWKTCCVLNKQLLEVDSFDEEWVNGIEQNIWRGEHGQHDDNETIPTSALPFALQRLHGPQERRQYREYDASSMGVGNDRAENTEQLNHHQQENTPPSQVIASHQSNTSNPTNNEETAPYDDQAQQLPHQPPNNESASANLLIEHNNPDHNHQLRHNVDNDANVVQIVREMQLSDFPSKLIGHFSIMHEQNALVWPSRQNIPRPTDDRYNLH